MSEKPSIVFVDDQSNILQTFRRSLRSMEEVWDIRYAQGGTEALRIVDSNRVDVVVSDTNMPGMRGTELLKEIQALYPATIRLVLSGGCRNDDISILLTSSHQFFAKPFDLEKLKETVTALIALRDAIDNPAVRKIVGGLSRLPCAPAVHKGFYAEMQETSPDIDKIAGYIAQDPALTAKMLQALNSTFFGINKAGIHPLKATRLMGPGTICDLFADKLLLSPIEAAHPNYAFLKDAWKRSLHCAHLMSALASSESVPEKMQEIAFTTGMLHNIGTIILAYELANDYAKIIPLFKNSLSQAQVEKKALGTTHAEVGAYFLGLWGFPAETVHAVAQALTPDKKADANQLTALLHIARTLTDSSATGQQAQIDTAYLDRAGISHGKMPSWQDLSKQALESDDVRSWKFS